MSEFSPAADVDPAVVVTAWVKRLRVVLAVTAAMGVVPFLVGTWVFLDDAAETTDDWHGLGMVLGGALAVSGLVLLGLGLLFRRLTTSGLTRALSGAATRLRVVSGIVVASGVAMSLPALNTVGLLVGLDSFAGLFGLPILGVGVALVVCGAGAFRSAEPAAAAAAAGVSRQGPQTGPADQWVGYGPPA